FLLGPEPAHARLILLEERAAGETILRPALLQRRAQRAQVAIDRARLGPCAGAGGAKGEDRRVVDRAHRTVEQLGVSAAIPRVLHARDARLTLASRGHVLGVEREQLAQRRRPCGLGLDLSALRLQLAEQVGFGLARLGARRTDRAPAQARGGDARLPDLATVD